MNNNPPQSTTDEYPDYCAPAHAVRSESVQTPRCEQVSELLTMILPTAYHENFDDPKHMQGSSFQRTRIAAAAEYCVRKFPGHLVEIGCHTGKTTRILAEIARRHNRKVIAVDPWQTKASHSKEGEFEEFQKTVSGFEKQLIVLRSPSQHPKAVAFLKQQPICFAFIDGGHGYEFYRSDIAAVSHTKGIIAVDDVLWSPAIERAFHEGAQAAGRAKLMLPLCREGYLLSPEQSNG